MMDPKVLAYDFDEEAIGFEEPPRVGREGGRAGQRLGAALVALGLLAFVLQITSGRFLGSWAGFLAVSLLVCAGGLVFFWSGYREHEPGIHNDGIHFSSAKHRGWIGWALG